ncbi:ParB N-terminal domain-containing protein [Nordella sp. HKS 07]|uniref:ParB/Srx family N-terminal domain-containing protein n=1 Tax=Nordella sp. HKS 07 TaxID=2712222 RepID=UPI0013E0F585|nr:ParB/Srx family N-terminal domain-containing protein [Nordella sp. HKS 07]QIG48955.1 ParB N-terminal domain-containing protein [Nordella sp. HKS 07]
MPDIRNVPVAELKPWPGNARLHSRKQVNQLAQSIRRFGFTHPILIDEENRILAGHGRVRAAGELGLAQVPCLRIDHLSPAEKRAYVLADNKLALNAKWDQKLLADELTGLITEDVTFDIGFSLAEIDGLIATSPAKANDDGKKVGIPHAPGAAGPAISGDLARTGWSVARH